MQVSVELVIFSSACKKDEYHFDLFVLFGTFEAWRGTRPFFVRHFTKLTPVRFAVRTRETCDKAKRHTLLHEYC